MEIMKTHMEIWQPLRAMPVVDANAVRPRRGCDGSGMPGRERDHGIGRGVTSLAPFMIAGGIRSSESGVAVDYAVA